MIIESIFVAFVILLLATQYYNPPWFRPLAVTAFVGHVFVAVVVLPLLPYGWDIAQFHSTALQISEGTFTTGSLSVSAFGGLQALLYVVFTQRPEVIGIFNGLFAILVYIPIAYLINHLYPSRGNHQIGVMLIVLFAPVQFLFLSIPMRDSLSVLIFFSLLSICLAVLKSHRVYLIPAAVPLWGLLYLLRNELGLVLFLGLIAGALAKIVRKVTDDLSLHTLSVVLGTVGIVGFGLFAELLFSFERANAQMTGRSSGGAVYLDGMEYTSWFDFLLSAPARSIYFQFAPFPLHIESAYHLLGFSMAVIAIVLFVAAARSLYECEIDETAAVFLLVIYATGIIGYGTINSNFGTNIRHRLVFDFLLVLFAAPVIDRWELLLRERLGIVPCHRNNGNEQ